MDNLRERLADLQHQQWSGWMDYLFSECEFDSEGRAIIPESLVKRWKRQVETPYADLPENEKNSDRTEADKYLSLFDECNAGR